MESDYGPTLAESIDQDFNQTQKLNKDINTHLKNKSEFKNWTASRNNID